MKSSPLFCFFVICSTLTWEPGILRADEEHLATPAITGPLTDGSPALIGPKPEPPRSLSKESVWYELPERLMEVRAVEFTNLPTPLPTPLPVGTETKKLQIPIRKPPAQFIFLSATVYDHQKTLIRWHPPGRLDLELEAWSNLDFNHFSGFSGFTANGNSYSLNMGIGNNDTKRAAALLARFGKTHQPPTHPPLPTGGPGFVLVKGDITDTAALDFMRDLHELYSTTGERLKQAWIGRENARIEAEALLKANPPQPKDAIIRFQLLEPEESAK